MQKLLTNQFNYLPLQHHFIKHQTFIIMAQLVNNFGFTFTPEEQQKIKQAADNAGANEVITHKSPTGHEVVWDFYDENDHFLFSFDRESQEVHN